MEKARAGGCADYDIGAASNEGSAHGPRYVSKNPAMLSIAGRPERRR
jgi:hypothetical protein